MDIQTLLTEMDKNPNCSNCYGTGVFSEDENENPTEVCIFCLEDTIMSGKLDGVINEVEWKAGMAVLDYQI